MGVQHNIKCSELAAILGKHLFGTDTNDLYEIQVEEQPAVAEVVAFGITNTATGKYFTDINRFKAQRSTVQYSESEVA